MLKNIWNWLWRRPAVFSIGSVLIVGGILGVIFWGGFNTFMEYTNQLEFCVSCHEMESTVYQEYKESPHYSNPSGVRVICSDCHVPKTWTEKLVRKVKASKELYHWAMGTVDTPEKFELHRLEMAERVWTTMKGSDSRECRNCHSYEAMNFEKQHKNAQKTMQKAFDEGRTCIECHRGIAHKLPDMMLTFKGNLADKTVSEGQSVSAGPKGAELYNQSGTSIGRLLPGSPVKIVNNGDDQALIEVQGWAPENYQMIITSQLGERFSIAEVTEEGRDSRSILRTADDLYGEQWQEVSMKGFAKKSELAEGVEPVWKLADRIYQDRCGSCHAAHAPTAYAINQWPGELETMADYGGLMGNEFALVKQYLQAHAKSLLRPKKVTQEAEEEGD